MQLTYSFRIYPATAQENKLLDWLDLCRSLYNIALEERQTVWKKEQRTIGYDDQQNNLPAFKKVHPEYKAVHSQVLQDVLRRVDTAYQNFFSRRAGYPRFKGRGDYFSITYPQVDRVKSTFSRLEEGFIYLSKIGYVKIRTHREAELSAAGRINVKLKNSQWYVNITCEVEEPNPGLLLQKSIGIDMGLSSLVATSDGQLIDNPRHLKKKEKHLRRIQRQLSRKQKGSKNRLKAKNKLSKTHLKVANQRKDFLHKSSNTLVQQNNIIIAEDLQVKNMAKKHCLAKSIHDAGWSRFLSYLEYKAKKHGKRFIQVPPNNTSQLCICGADVPKDLSVRVHTCPKCGYTDNREILYPLK